MPQFTIDPEFKALCHPLAPEERAGLECDISTRGCLQDLIIWTEENVLLDGHNRYEICTDLGKTFGVKYQSFPNRTEAKIWIITHGMNKRNYSAFQRAEAALKLEPLYQERAKANQKQSEGRGKKGMQNSADLIEPVTTRDEIATVAKVSHDTVSKVKTILESGNEELIQDVRAGNVSIHKASKQVKEATTTKPVEPKPYDVEADARRFRELRDRLCGNWADDWSKKVMAQTFRQLANEV